MNLEQVRKDKALAHVVPLAFFLVVMAALGGVAGNFEWDHSAAPWWQRKPDHWIYPVQSVLCLVLLLFWWKHYEFNWSLKGIVIATVLGAVGIGFWLLPTQTYEWMGFKDDEEVPWLLQKLGVAERRDGFDARAFGPDATRFDFWGDYLSLFLRFFRAVVIVSLVEEIFWRGFLMRWLLNRDGNYWAIPFGKPSWLTYGVVTLAFMIAHAPVDWAGAIAFGSVMYGCAIWTKSLGACIWMHGVANLLMGWYAISTGKLGLW